MRREIFEVYAKIVDANGSYNTLSGYPQVFDSRSYSGDIAKAQDRAYGAWHEVLGAMYKRDDRQLQLALILRASDGLVLESTVIGTMTPLPDPEPEPEPSGAA